MDQQRRMEQTLAFYASKIDFVQLDTAYFNNIAY